MQASLTRQGLALAVFALCIGGCAARNSAPPPSIADLGLVDQYSAERDVTEATTPAAAIERPDLDRWWDSFGDPVLEALIERGRSENLDVQEAVLAGEKGAAGLETLQGGVAADIARTYILLRSRQAMIENIRDFLAQRDALIRLAQFRAQAGLVPPLDIARAVARRNDVAVRLPDLEAENLQAIGRIAVLTGQAPQALGDLADGMANVPTGPTNVAIGTPSELVLRTAPSPKQARTSAGQIAYKRAFLNALQAVEAQRTAFHYAKLREFGLAGAAATAEEAARLARKAYADGLADYSTLEQVEAGLLSTRNAYRQAQAQRALALVGLYLALRGDGGPGTPAADKPGD